MLPETAVGVGRLSRRVCSALLAVALVAGCSAPAEKLRVAPAFTLPGLVGTDSLSLADLRGDYVLMNFWASWCGPCLDEIPVLVKIHQRFAGQGLRVLGVTVNDRPDDSRGFVREYGVVYPNVIGNEGVYEEYRLSPWIPTTLLIGPRGEILKEWVGPQTESSFLGGIRDAAPGLRRLADSG